MKYLIIFLIFIIGLTLISWLSIANQFSIDAATFDSSLIPGADNIYDLGFDSSPRWKDANLSGNMIIGGNLSIGTTTIKDKLYVNDGNITQNLSSSTPVQIGAFDVSNDIYSIFVSGKYAYLGLQNTTINEFRIIDITNPASSTQVGQLDMPQNINSLYVAGRYAYLGLATTTGGAFRIIDVSNPSSPTQIGSLDTQYAFNIYESVFVSGRYAYLGLSTSTYAFRIIDIANPANPIEVGRFNLPTINSIYVAGKYAYVALNQNNGALRIIDISNPYIPRQVGQLNMPQDIHALYVSGRYAYVGMSEMSSNKEFAVIDVSNPSSPISVANLEMGARITALSASGKYVYVGLLASATTTEFKIIDVSNTSNLSEVASLEISVNVASLFISGRYAYVGLSNTINEFRIYDISGMESVSANIHSLEAGNLQVRNDIIAQGQLQVSGGINVGTGGIFSAGPIGISIASTTQTDAISAYFQGRVGIATTTPTQKLEVNGGIRIFTGDAKSACNATSTRGTLWFTASSSAPENKDTFEICAKDSGNTYNWRTLY